MENRTDSDRLIHEIAASRRVLALGGLAVISHGLGRNTHDADIWVEPMESPEIWASVVGPLVYSTPSAKPVAIAVWEPIPEKNLAEVIARDGVFRINGLDRPIDIFRKPNELPIEEFESAWVRAKPLHDGTRLPDEIDLLMTKQLTGRDKDLMDIAFLENKAEKRYLAELPATTEERAVEMLERFLTPKVAEAALAHPSETVRQRAMSFLRELAAEGDPFAADILKNLPR
jgi:hypothetical protein